MRNWRTETLVRRALSASDEHEYWKYVVVLQERASPEVLETAARLLRDSQAKLRSLGAGILGQLGYLENAYREERRDLLLRQLGSETDEDVLSSILSALSHAREFEDHTGTPEIVAFARHPSREVRFGAVLALLAHEEPLAVEALIRLSRDGDTAVRDWATFALGTQIDLDNLRIREALRARIPDEDEETRAEALVGLARRGDPAAVDPLIREIHGGSPGTLFFDACRECGDSRLLDPLRALLRSSRDEANVCSDWLRSLEETVAAISAPAGPTSAGPTAGSSR